MKKLFAAIVLAAVAASAEAQQMQIRTTPGMAGTASDRAGFAVCEVHCDGTTVGPIDFRLTAGFEKRAGAWTIVHEHHSMPATDEILMGPEVDHEEIKP